MLKDNLDDLLDDPIMHLLMASDGVRPQEVRQLLQRAQQRGAERQFVPPAYVIAQECLRNVCRA